LSVFHSGANERKKEERERGQERGQMREPEGKSQALSWEKKRKEMMR